MKFLSETHKKRFEALAQLSGRTSDRERLPLFYILSAFEDTYECNPLFYNYEKNCIHSTAFSHVRLDYDSHEELVRLGFNLYNSSHKCNPCEMLITCGNSEREVAIEAIKIRFGMEDDDE
jgi:hypothetical protein